MKVQTALNDVERVGQTTGSEFVIKASAKAFAILSSNLYSDKIKAIVRELSCNAYDAHVAAGCADKPFVVHLPNTMSPEFYVKDFGTGLSREQLVGYDHINPATGAVEHVPGLYQTFFDSNKTDSNQFIGALGLGSKSPLAYTDLFTVESRHKGMKYVCSVFWNEDRAPEIALMAEMPTDEENGVTVSFPVRGEDYFTFADRARTALMYFNPQPVIMGALITPYTVTPVVSGSNWTIVNRGGDWRTSTMGATVKQGPVIYPIDADVIRSKISKPAIAAMVDWPIDFNVAMGDVDVAPSREALSYDARTVNNVVDLFVNFAAELEQQLQDTIDSAPTLWDARMRLLDLQTHASSHVTRYMKHLANNGDPYMWNGVELNSHGLYDISDSMFANIKVSSVNSNVTSRGVSLGSGVATDELTIQFAKDLHVLLADIPLRSHRASFISRFCKDYKRTIVIDPVDYKKYVGEAEIAANHLAAEMGGAKVIKLSSMQYNFTAKTSTYKARSIDEVLVWSDGRMSDGSSAHSFSRNTWKRETIAFDDGGFYIPVKRFVAFLDDGLTYEMAPFLLRRLASVCGLCDIDKFVGLTEAQLTKAREASAANGKQWINMADVIKQKVEAVIADGSLVAHGLRTEVSNNRILEVFAKDVNFWKIRFAGVGVDDNSDMMLLLSEINSALTRSKLTELEAARFEEIANLLQIRGGRSQVATRVAAIMDLWANMIGRYPMLQYSIGTMQPRDVIDYVELVERNHNCSAATAW